MTAPPWPVAALGLVLSQLLTAVALSAHEAMHGSVFPPGPRRQLLAWLGLAPLLVTPGMWVAWHVQAHHGHANRGGLDPDALYDVSDHHAVARLRRWVTLGTDAPVASVLANLVLFSLQGQLFLWVVCDDPALRDKLTLDRRRERLLTVLLALGWGALAVAIGPWATLWGLVVPFLGMNATLMGYIATQHWLLPHTEADDPARTTQSVTVPRWIDRLHFEFAWHQEHHVFPRMSHRFGPQVRAAVQRLEPEAVPPQPVGRVLWRVWRTPSSMDGPATLSSLDRRRRVPLPDRPQGA
ncbi:MAG: fatty acid desaturase [Myxococcota bacterium]